MSELIHIARPWLAVEHAQLRSHMLEFDRCFPNHSIKWRGLGEAAVTLLERGEYLRYVEKKQGQLQHKDPRGVAAHINQSLAAQPTEPHSLSIETYDVDFFGRRRYLSIAYLLDPDVLSAERDRTEATLDRLNGVNGFLDTFDPHLAVATIESVDATNEIFDAFNAIRPTSVTLEYARAVAA